MNKRLKRIFYITGTRADFGLMSNVLKKINESKYLKLYLYATGMHLMKEYGYTINIVKKEFNDVKVINSSFEKNDKLAVGNFIGQLSVRLTSILTKVKPDIVIVLGDRPEMITTAVISSYLGIPIAHIHGGDRSYTIDEVVRHAITKLSHIHFPATKEAARRIIKMGEEKWRIYVVGAPALDVIYHEKLPSRKQLFRYLNINHQQKIILTVQHPSSESMVESVSQFTEIIKAVKKIHLPVVLIYPNADPGSSGMIELINKEKNNPLFKIFPSLEYKYFLALEREASVLVGNSSSFMIESSSFHTPVVNIGERQRGRQHGSNIMNIDYNSKRIFNAIRKSLFDKEYLKNIRQSKNPWGDGKTGERIVKILENVEINQKLLTKQVTY